MTYLINRGLVIGSLFASVMLGGCVWQSDYDALQTQNKDLQEQLAAQIKYTVNSDLLFPSGGWEMSEAGKRIIAGFAQKLAPTQQNKLYVSGFTDNTPIGPALAREGVTSNQILSQKRAESVMQFLISQGVKPDLVAAKGFGESNPVASNTTAAGRAKNRRVELSLAPM
ncbi:MAG: OmpA family protein [Alphaproteobacteria bacterium]|nr:OmpA family protein [Alphaproteobacteria bacterium]